ncbi:MAG: hypothetical protein ACLQM8_16850 [Limisphaerales bacterium]
MIRGGNWNNNARNCRSANRNNNNPSNRNNNIGFRVVLAPAQPARRRAHWLTRLPSRPARRDARRQTERKPKPPGASRGVELSKNSGRRLLSLSSLSVTPYEAAG